MDLRIFDDKTAKGPFFPVLPSGKSLSHRALIAAALAGEGSEVFCLAENDDVRATAEALSKRGEDFPVIDCGESATTLRLLLPVFAVV